MKWRTLSGALALSALLVVLPVAPSSAGPCPSVCACKWKGGKQTVECLERALITIPEHIDGETQVLDMSGNNLQIVPRETFYKANLTNLQKVFLRSCRIGQIGDRAFRGLTNLVELDLSHNLLTAVPSATFEDTPFLRYLSLADNPIQKIESNAFATVTGMAKIDLSDCEIQIISPSAFDRLESLEWLKLNGNKLTELHPRTVDAIGRLHGVELHDNPWSCDCKLRPVKEWLSRNGVPYPVAPKCRGPERVAGRTFADLDADDFACRPEMLPASRYVEAAAGENATVACRVGAVPAANVHWYWNGRLLLNNSAFSAYQRVFTFEEGKFEKSSSLVLTNALETDSGEFYCVAENRAGTAEANFTLRVSPRAAGMASLGSGQIAGLGAALVVLVLAILAIASILLLRLRRLPFSESKTPGQLEVIATVNGSGVTTTTKAAQRTAGDPADRKEPRTANPPRKPPGTRESFSSGDPAGDAASGPPSRRPAGNNPDIIRDAKPEGPTPALPARGGAARPDGGDSVRAARDCLRAPGIWGRDPDAPDPYARRAGDDAVDGEHFDASDKTPIIGEDDDDDDGDGDGECRFARGNADDYPPDYGLPILEREFRNPEPSSPSCSGLPPEIPDAKTARAWHRGVPVLPPATALKRVLANSRNSPDEGYQEGCGTDV